MNKNCCLPFRGGGSCALFHNAFLDVFFFLSLSTTIVYGIIVPKQHHEHVWYTQDWPTQFFWILNPQPHVLPSRHMSNSPRPHPPSLFVASPNDIHNSEKLRNPFLSGSAILNAAPLYVSCKNAHPQSKFRPIALQHTSNWSAFVLLFNSAGKNNHVFKNSTFFWCFSRFLQISLDF